MNSTRGRTREVVLGVLILTNLLVWLALWQSKQNDILEVSFLDVGQGDAIFIETPNKYQVLIDGGKNRKVVSELGKLMPFGDRSIDVVISTHPDADHIGGLPEVVSRYQVGLYLEPGVESENDLDNELNTRLENRKVEKLLARRGQVIDFGDGVKLVVLFPNTDVSNWETNDASIVAKLVYRNQSFLLTGDAGIKTENALMNLAMGDLDVDVLQAGHHGSRTSTSLSFAQAASPIYAIISAGKDNSYGHPHQEVINTLQKVGAEILGTALEGTITFETDGKILKYR